MNSLPPRLCPAGRDGIGLPLVGDSGGLLTSESRAAGAEGLNEKLGRGGGVGRPPSLNSWLSPELFGRSYAE